MITRYMFFFCPVQGALYKLLYNQEAKSRPNAAYLIYQLHDQAWETRGVEASKHGMRSYALRWQYSVMNGKLSLCVDGFPFQAGLQYT